jgi:hypothetical protein
MTGRLMYSIYKQMNTRRAPKDGRHIHYTRKLCLFAKYRPQSCGWRHPTLTTPPNICIITEPFHVYDQYRRTRLGPHGFGRAVKRWRKHQ